MRFARVGNCVFRFVVHWAEGRVVEGGGRRGLHCFELASSAGVEGSVAENEHMGVVAACDQAGRNYRFVFCFVVRGEGGGRRIVFAGVIGRVFQFFMCLFRSPKGVFHMVLVSVTSWSEVWRYGGISEPAMEPYPPRMGRNLRASITVIFLCSTNLLEKIKWPLAGI